MADYRLAMQEFFAVLFEVHPRPDFRTPMPLLQEERRRCEAGAGACETAAQFARLAGRFLHLVGDGHTYLEASRQAEVAVPVSLRWIEGLPVVDRVLDATLGVERGDVLLAVNGREALRVLQERLSEESYAETAWGLRRAVSRLLTFPRAEAPGDAVALTVAGADGRVRTAALPLLPVDGEPFAADFRSTAEDHCRRPFFTEWHDDIGAAVFRYRICADRGGGWYFWEPAGLGVAPEEIPDMAETCAQLFADLRRRGARRLVVDLRENWGGNSNVGMCLYPYLTQRDLVTYGWTTRISPITQEHLRSIREKPLGDDRVPPGVLRYPYRPDLRLAPDLPRFSGPVAVLIDSSVFSSGEWLAVELHDNDLGTFVGEPTGCGGTVPGEMLRIRLREADVTLFCSCRIYERPGPDQGSVQPHVFARPTLADFRAGRDPVLERALSLPL